MAMRDIPKHLYFYCKDMGMTENIGLEGYSITLGDLLPGQVGMVQAYELSRIANALEENNAAAKIIAKQIANTNAIFERIHKNLKEPRWGE